MQTVSDGNNRIGDGQSNVLALYERQLLCQSLVTSCAMPARPQLDGQQRVLQILLRHEIQVPRVLRLVVEQDLGEQSAVRDGHALLRMPHRLLCGQDRHGLLSRVSRWLLLQQQKTSPATLSQRNLLEPKHCMELESMASLGWRHMSTMSARLLCQQDSLDRVLALPRWQTLPRPGSHACRSACWSV